MNKYTHHCRKIFFFYFEKYGNQAIRFFQRELFEISQYNKTVAVIQLDYGKHLLGMKINIFTSINAQKHNRALPEFSIFLVLHIKYILFGFVPNSKNINLLKFITHADDRKSKIVHCYILLGIVCRDLTTILWH